VIGLFLFENYVGLDTSFKFQKTLNCLPASTYWILIKTLIALYNILISMLKNNCVIVINSMTHCYNYIQ